MKKMRVVIYCLMIFAVVIGCSEKTSESGTGKGLPPKDSGSQVVRQSAVAGSFYPGDKDDLLHLVDGYLEKAVVPPQQGGLFGIIVPHAGYIYSGPVAAYGFKAIRGADVDTVIIIGSSHRAAFDGMSIFPKGYFETPLGKVEIDSDLAEAIQKESPRFLPDVSPHTAEHSLEVELPFLQRVLTDFRIVPVLFGNDSATDYKILADAIVKTTKGKNVLIVASSDLSHYPSYEDARLSDKILADAILTGKIENVDAAVRKLEGMNLRNTVTFACGIDAIKTIMRVAELEGVKNIRLLNAANSGDATSDKSRVVGYAAIGFYKESAPAAAGGGLLNEAQKKQLLDIAKATVESYVASGKIPDFNIADPALNQRLGAFVTLRIGGRLRGCIGRFSPTDIPLYKVVREMAVAAASEDPRFKPVAKGELDKIEYEISVLSNLSEAKDWKEIEAGKHGVKIVRGFAGGVFLPQVATENGWNLETFLSELCAQKAGLSPNCYKEKGTRLYTFTAQVF